jgi:DNA mismatch repair protein MSH5
MTSVGEMVTQTINFEESEISQRTAVLEHVSPQLDELKRKYNGLENFLDEVANHLKTVVPEWAKQYILNCIFYPQLGFLTVININPQTGMSNYEGEGLEGDPWEQMFAIEGKIYYKNGYMREMDKEIGDLYCMICGKLCSV